MPTDPTFVHVYHVGTRRKRWVPEHWLSDDGPFPGQFRPVPSTTADGGEDGGRPAASAITDQSQED